MSSSYPRAIADLRVYYDYIALDKDNFVGTPALSLGFLVTYIEGALLLKPYTEKKKKNSGFHNLDLIGTKNYCLKEQKYTLT